MFKKLDVIHKQNFEISRWSGGTTTELFIYPESAVYAKRDFSWRLSSALVETPESDFTPLSGFKRIIMVLDGELELVHQDHHTVKLTPFEQDRFSGDWQTKSIGLATDFNLILNQNSHGDLSTIHLSPKEDISPSLDHSMLEDGKYDLQADAFYLVNGEAELVFEDNWKFKLLAKQLFLINRELIPAKIKLQIKNTSEENITIVHAKIVTK